jgi:hypothetical protein
MAIKIEVDVYEGNLHERLITVNQMKSWSDQDPATIMRIFLLVNFYGSIIVPLIVPDEASVARSTKRSTTRLPVAPSNRPLPPLIVYVSTMETMPGVEVRVPCPDPSAKRVEPSAATTVADSEAAKRVGKKTSP